jgi:hypothetical protein
MQPLFFGAIFLELISLETIIYRICAFIPSALSAQSTAEKPRSGPHSLYPPLDFCAFLSHTYPAQITRRTALPLKTPRKNLSSELTASFYVS